MYESFFALKEKPFALTPNQRFLFLSKTHKEVYAHLIYGIESRAGFVEVTGEVGTGKSTILRTLLSHLDEDKYRVSFIFNPKLTAFELLRNINREFGVADDGLSSADLIQTLNEFLLAENQEGRTPILVIDEAQNLSGEVLEQIRLLSNLETEEDKLIQVILVGQPELRHHLSDHSLRQLNQRIAVRYQLRPLNREETTSYILHRLNIAGRPDGNVFTQSALKKVFQCSGGVLRRINLICDRALLTAYSEERGTVSPRDVKQAVAELAGMGEGSQKASQAPWNTIAVLAVLLLFLFVGFYWFELFGKSSVDATVTQTENQLARASNQPVPPSTTAVEPVSNINESVAAPISEPAEEFKFASVVFPAPVKEMKALASTIMHVDVGAQVVTLQADGLVGNYKFFSLGGPDRLVVDVYGVKPGFEARSVPLPDDFSRMRVGVYKEKLRFVFDTYGKFPKYNVTRKGESVVISWGSGTSTVTNHLR
jgi:general secretion pathway protein A